MQTNPSGELQLARPFSPLRGAASAVLALAAVISVALLATRVGYQPIWDGRIYADCITEAARHFSPATLRCADHASQAYVALAAMVQALVPGSYPLLLATNAVLLAIACVGFHRVLRHVFPAPDLQLDRALLTAAVALQPSFLASVVHPGIDLPLLAGFVWCIAFALERRRLALVAVGTAIAFSKETGVLLYAVLLLCLGLMAIFRRNRTLAERVREFRRLVPLAYPGIFFAAYLLYRAIRPNTVVLWATATTSSSLLEQFLLPQIDLYRVNYAVLIFVLNFAWIMTAALLADMFVGVVRAMHRDRRRVVHGADASSLAFVTLLAVAVVYALTRFITFGHPRYFLTCTAVVLPVCLASLLRLQVPPAARRAVTAIYALLLIPSALRTVDPVSRHVYGTFPVGSHDMLRMTSVTRECCGYGQDQLVYSLEFTVLQSLTDKALVAFDRPPNGAVVVPDTTSWLFIDPPWGTSRPLGFWAGSTDRVVVDHGELVRGLARPDSGIYIALPFADNERAFRALSPSYAFADERTVRDGGYAMSVYRIVRRPRP